MPEKSEKIDEKENKKRVFVSIDIPKSVKKQIKEIQERIPEFKGKLTETENLHLTLKFLGEQDLDIIKKVNQKLKEIDFSKLNCNIDSIGVFSQKYIRIVWLKIFGVEELQKIVDEKLSEIGFDKEKRFMGHLTIARVKTLKNKKIFLEKIETINILKLNFIVERFFLKESVLKPEGPEYSILSSYRSR